MTDDQGEAIAFLSRGASYGQPGAEVTRVETHGAIVFLVGEHAYKLKRAVRFSFLDYSTLAARERFCRAEYMLNRRTAPTIYRAVHAITRAGHGALEFDGPGTVADWVVEMWRFPADSLFDDLARHDRLTPRIMTRLADVVAQFHEGVEVVETHGGCRAIAAVIADNHAVLAAGGPMVRQDTVAALHAASLSELHAIAGLLNARRMAGKVRRCHGDLHLRNIFLLEDEPTLFDCIEFSDELSCIDVLYDLAFLLMDLCHRGLLDLANTVLNRYLDRTGDIEGLRALPLFMSVRAAIRAKVAALSGPGAAGDAADYTTLASEMLRRQPMRLIAVGGLSGSGKSTVAAALAPEFLPAPGARVIRSDVLHKAMLNAAPEERLLPEAYEPSIRAKVYAMVADQTVRALASGVTVIVDATFLAAQQRDQIEALASRAMVPFTGLWLAGTEPILAERLDRRVGDASDADAAVLHQQLLVDTGAIPWHRISADREMWVVIATAREMVRSDASPWSPGERRLQP
jgi:uncharacterized protein